MAFTTARLISQVEAKGALPQGRFTNAEILSAAYDVLLSEITPMMIAYREEYYIRTIEYSVTANQQNYKIPDRAFGLTIREVKIINTDNVVKDIERMQIEDIDSEEAGTPEKFFMQGSNVMLYPKPSSTSGTLRIYYHFIPNSLIETTEATQITAIDTGTNTLTFASIPSTWTTADEFDLIEGRNGYEVLAFDLTASAITSTDVTLSSLPSGLIVGDWLSLAGESPFAYLPKSAHTLLVYLTAASLLEDIGDQDNLRALMARAGAIKSSLDNVFSLRVEGAPKSLTTPLL